MLNYTYTSGKIFAVDYATIDWDPGVDDRVHTIADIEIQQSGGIGNAAANGTLTHTCASPTTAVAPSCPQAH